MEKGEKVIAELPIRNVNRVTGTITSYEVTKKHGAKGLPEDTIRFRFKGSAGQSFGAFLVQGVRLTLNGEANDYVGKGMADGEIIIRVSDDAKFEAANNTIAGNTCFYGATGGKAFFNGRAGERFGVRNSGATVVIEGCGDHGCEYMTNGTVVILGKTGKNFGAGMSGGTAYIYDIDDRAFSRINTEMVVALPLVRKSDLEELKSLIETHAAKTGSPRAKALLADWSHVSGKFIRVIAKERAALEAAEEKHEAASIPTAAK
ncbi:MAG: hypothetical protein CFE26_17390 [Verrucomicrobiales bacterium VVV1]|nr:MAG: hypothetical protein CFE26_17390 [Verrucomicrobiales bacterium VVV1]